jgi:pimeloyl-ACP methyl ester carboxylesterase
MAERGRGDEAPGEKMMDEGTGPPVVVIPGIQGRWEWMAPALRELRLRCRAISYTLCGDSGSGLRYAPSLGFDNYLRQLDMVFERAGVTRAALCGVSYGGFIAFRYAATRPERVSALVLVSAPAPGWEPSERQQRFLDRPRLRAPLFMLTGPGRIWEEVRSAIPSRGARMYFAVTYGARVLSAPITPSRAVTRIADQRAVDFSGDGARVKAPTLVVTGEDSLDHVVPPPVSREYLSLIPGAIYTKLDGTGHIGMITQPARFADVVSSFVHANSH